MLLSNDPMKLYYFQGTDTFTNIAVTRTLLNMSKTKKGVIDMHKYAQLLIQLKNIFLK